MMMTPAKGAGALRQTADERRTSVLRAMSEFARGGYAGTSTEAIAGRRDLPALSVPPLRDQAELFIATMSVMYARIESTFRGAAEGLSGVEAMAAMGEAYKVLLGERDLLLVQLHAFAASEDEEIRGGARGLSSSVDRRLRADGPPRRGRPRLLRPGDAPQRGGGR